jgi:hypothetical protein
VLAGLIGGITWNLVTWLHGLPTCPVTVGPSTSRFNAIAPSLMATDLAQYGADPSLRRVKDSQKAPYHAAGAVLSGYGSRSTQRDKGMCQGRPG